MLGVMPGYYNSATGLVASLIPKENLYFQYGFFDGNLAQVEQLGFDGPHFNGYWLHLIEAGGNWTVGSDKKPGKFGAVPGFRPASSKALAVSRWRGGERHLPVRLAKAVLRKPLAQQSRPDFVVSIRCDQLGHR